MTAADLAVVLVTVATLAAFIGLLFVLARLLRQTRELRLTLEAVHRETVPLIDEMYDTVAQAGLEVERVDGLLDAAASIQQTVDSASRLTYLAFARPLIKVVAVGKGVRRGTNRTMNRSGRRRRRLEARREATPPMDRVA